MPKRAHTEEQIVAALRQGEAGEKVAETAALWLVTPPIQEVLRNQDHCFARVTLESQLYNRL